MKAQHTPGPWVPVSPATNGSEFWEVEDGYGRTATVYGKPDDPETIATVNLVAAAPDLLAALAAAEQEMTYRVSTRNSDALRQVRAAIAKATGEAV